MTGKNGIVIYGPKEDAPTLSSSEPPRRRPVDLIPRGEAG